MAITKIQVHAINTEKGLVTEAQIKQMLAGAKSVYTLANLAFELVSYEEDFSPALKNDPTDSSGGYDDSPLKFEIERQSRAVRYPGRLVIFFRPGGNSASSTWADYVVMAGVSPTDFAHEVGHFFHLSHTFSEDSSNPNRDTHINTIFNKKPYKTRLDYVKGLIRNAVESGDYKVENALDIFDADKWAGVNDTPPDPGPPIFQPNDKEDECCTDLTATPPQPATISLNVKFTNGKSHTYIIQPDKSNIMSYFKHCPGSHTISQDQCGVVMRALVSRNRRHLAEGVSPEGPAAVVTPQGAIHVFVRGDDHNIWRSFWNGSAWSGWQADLGVGEFTSGPSAVVTSAGHIHVFARGTDQNIWHSFWNGNVWSGWRNDLGTGTLTSGPSSVLTSGGHIHVFARGADRNIWHSFWNGNVWSGWRNDLGTGTLTSGPSSVLTSGGHIHVFARGTDRNIWHSFWNGTVWSGWRDDLGAGTLTSGPGAVVSSDKAIHLFARGDDRNMWHNFWNGKIWSGWQADLVRGSFMSAGAAVVTADKAIHVFAQGNDLNIWHCFSKNKVWSGWKAELGAGTFQP